MLTELFVHFVTALGTLGFVSVPAIPADACLMIAPRAAQVVEASGLGDVWRVQCLPMT